MRPHNRHRKALIGNAPKKIHQHCGDLREATQERQAATFPQDVINEKTRLRLEEFVPELRPRYTEKIARTEEELTRQARYDVTFHRCDPDRGNDRER